jgi:hypothetical protein
MPDPGEHPGTCGICGERVDAADVLRHLHVEHGIDPDIAEWPDGQPVVIDHTLTPDDFDG